LWGAGFWSDGYFKSIAVKHGRESMIGNYVKKPYLYSFRLPIRSVVDIPTSPCVSERSERVFPRGFIGSVISLIKQVSR